MRLTAEQVAQGLLHPKSLVRNAALRYFAKAFSLDSTVMPLAAQAVDTYGWDEAFEYPSYLSWLVHTEETFQWLIARMQRIGHPQTRPGKEECLGLAGIIVRADVDLLAKNQQTLQSLRGLRPQHRRIIADRVRLRRRDAETCWNELYAWCREYRAVRHINEADLPAAERLVEALARDAAFCADRILDVLSQEIEDCQDNPMAWMACLVARLAGESRLEAAAPLLAEKLRLDGGDLLNEECMYSLVKIGTDSAVQALCDRWPSEPDHFKLYGISSLENIHGDAKVQRCLALYPAEDSISHHVGLLRAVLTSFASEGVEHARQFILDGGWGLEREVLAAATLAGISFPELPQWLEKEEAAIVTGRERRRQLFAPPPRKGKRKVPSVAQLGESPVLPLIEKPKAGRNDPCPCGSGRKYKKCCLNKR